MWKISLNTSGLDCSGKQTFNDALFKVLSDNGITPFSNSVFSFPRYEENEYGKSLYHLLRAGNKNEIENVIMDLFHKDHSDFLEKTFQVFVETPESKIIMCDRCSHEPLIFNVGEAYFNGTDKDMSLASNEYWDYKKRVEMARGLIESRHRILNSCGRDRNTVELNLFFMMNGGKNDSDELKRRLDLKQDKDSNETLEFQKMINERFQRVLEDVDYISAKHYVSERVFNVGFSLSTPTEEIIQFFLEFSKLIESHKHLGVKDFKDAYCEIVQRYSRFGYICMATL